MHGCEGMAQIDVRNVQVNEIPMKKSLAMWLGICSQGSSSQRLNSSRVMSQALFGQRVCVNSSAVGSWINSRKTVLGLRLE